MAIEAVTTSAAENRRIEFRNVHPETAVALDTLFKLVTQRYPNITRDEVVGQAVSFITSINSQSQIGRELFGEYIHGYDDEIARRKVEETPKTFDPDSHLVPIRYATDAILAAPLIGDQEFEQILLRADFYFGHFYAKGLRLFMRTPGKYDDREIPYPFKEKGVGLNERLRSFARRIGVPKMH